MNGRGRLWRSMAVLFISIITAAVSYPIYADAAEAIKESRNKIIYIVYDNSGSTYKFGGENRSYWSEINYGVQAFYAMTGEEDEIKIYKTSSTDSSYDAGIASKGYSGNSNAQTTLSKIRGIDVVNGAVSLTSVESIQQAIENLNSQQGTNAEKWLVIFTDGQFDKTSRKEYTEKEFADILNSSLEGTRGIQVCYIPLSDAAANSYLNTISNAAGIFQPSEKNDIAKQLLEVCNHIYGRRNVKNVEELGYSPASLENGSLKITFDIPISKCILYAYCDELINEKLGGDILWQECIQAPQTLNLTGRGTEPDEVKTVTKTGFIAELKVNPAQNKSVYTVAFPENVENMQYEIYYEPAFTVTPQILQEDKGTAEGKYVAGDCVVSLIYANAATGEPVDGNANFLAAESFEVSVAGNGNNQKLSETPEGDRWEGTILPGEAVITASTTGITGETSVELGKDYLGADLIATLDEIYLMDRLGDRKQYIRLEAVLDGENVTDEIQELRALDEDFLMSFGLDKDGKSCKSIVFEEEYDAVANCWKVYPLFKDQTDYSVSGVYDFHAAVKLNTDYYKDAVDLKTDEKFHVGISEGEIAVHIENPWECRVGGILFPKADRTDVSLEWNGQKLPAEVIKGLDIYGGEDVQPDIEYFIDERSKDTAGIKGRKWWDLFFQEDGTDSLTIEGKAVIFGIEKDIYDYNIQVNIHGLSVWRRIWFVFLWCAVSAAIAIIIVKIAAHQKGVKAGKRFRLNTQVYRCYESGRNRVRGRIKRKTRKEPRLGRYVEYTLMLYLPEEFNMGDDLFSIKVRRTQNSLKILSMPQIQKCDEVLLERRPYTENSCDLRLDQKITLKKGKSVITIQLENV